MDINNNIKIINNSYKKDTNEKGITLISLVVTIILLIILSGVMLGLVLGDGGVIRRVQGSVDSARNK